MRRDNALIRALVCCSVAAALWLPGAAQAGHSHRYQVARQLAHGLQGTPLAPYAWLLEREGHRWNVNPFLVAAIAGTESSFGAAACGTNPFGWASCQGTQFASFGDAIRTVTRSLREDYMNRWHEHTVEAIGVTYCACGSHWAVTTRSFMARFGPGGEVTYPGEGR